MWLTPRQYNFEKYRDIHFWSYPQAQLYYIFTLFNVVREIAIRFRESIIFPIPKMRHYVYYKLV